MLVKSLKIKNESMFYPNEYFMVNNFDGQLLKIKKEKIEKIIIFIIFLIK